MTVEKKFMDDLTQAYTHLDNDKIISAKQNIDNFVKSIDKDKAKKGRAKRKSANS